MSGNSSDSETSSCGWTIINHEGSDIETLTCENGESNGDFASEETPVALEAELEDRPRELRADWEDSTLTTAGRPLSLLDQMVPAAEVEDDKLSDVGCVGGISDDSDIVTLEPPKVEEMETQEEAGTGHKNVECNEDFNMGSSSSSQYTFSQPETVFPHRPSADESSNDEASDQTGPLLKRRRAKRRTLSASDSDDRPPAEQEAPQQKETPNKLSGRLNSCIILALVIAVSMGFGHFHGKPEGTIQIQERQKQVERIHEDELNDMKDDLYQCQMEQESTVNHKVKMEDLGTCLKVTEGEKLSFNSQKDDLAAENRHLRESLEKEEKALSLLQEELRKLREQIRNLEDKDVGTDLVLTENQKLKEHLEEDKQRISNFLNQKKTYLAEAQMLRRELDKERHITEALREELERLTSVRLEDQGPQNTQGENQEIVSLQGRLTELEKKLNFEQQRSDLWERLYIEAKEHNEKPEIGKPKENYEKEQKKDGKGEKTKKKPKGSLFGSVKDTFDAMKNSTKEFVRHHKEKIKQAKEAVKQNLKKFSDSVKSTFRHFKDSTKNMFDKNQNKKTGEKRQEDMKKAKSAYREYQDSHPKPRPRNAPRWAPGMQTQAQDSRTHKPSHEIYEKEKVTEKCSRSQHSHPKGCTGVFECAHQESFSLFNKVLDPVRVDEFNQLLQRYLQQEVGNFHHWGELEKFINKFFCNGVFIHDQMLFTDFVNNVEDYLEDMEEYRIHSDDVFEDLDEFIYKHFFGNTYSTSYGSSQHLDIPHHKTAKGSRHGKEEEQPPRYKREGKWHKHSRPNGRHMANLEIELGQLPFDPKY